MKIRLALVLLLSLVSFRTMAMDGSSGCGPGWYVFTENSLVSSMLRSTTNAFLFPAVTIGMTVGTSNCTQHKIVVKEKESLYFATMNHFELKGDVARGQGEYLSAFATTIGCPASAQARFDDQMKAHFSNLYPSSDVKPESVMTEVYRTILNDRELTNKCSLGAA